ncbi:MAG: hypothetical protein O7E52_25175 [Candidatus Poribacteria bacterium]|nr:hypothetical protein [Candidatus Poribacteria bacterium]
MDRATIALIISVIALLLSVSKWIHDLRTDRTSRGIRRRRRWKSSLRVELLEGQTNCFITRGGYLLFLISCRVYNDNDHAPVSIEGYMLQAKIGRKWRDTELYNAPQAMIFPSLLRNDLPFTLKPDGRQDFYEVFALDELIPSPEIKIRLKLTDKAGKTVKCQNTFKHRVDERPVFDLLFRTLE